MCFGFRFNSNASCRTSPRHANNISLSFSPLVFPLYDYYHHHHNLSCHLDIRSRTKPRDDTAPRTHMET